MAKSGKSGLGRGLGALMGENLVETGSMTAASEKKQQQKVEQTEKPIQSDASSNVSRETPQNPPSRPASEGKAHAGLSAREEAKLEEEKRHVKPYIEEDDHVTIVGVKEREAKPRAPKEKPKQQADENEVPLRLVVPNPDQPRTQFKKEVIEELAASIEKEGLLQPILVRRVGEQYQIIAGERRWQACKSLGMKTIPVRIREATDDKALELALIENVQREDLNPIEEAYGYKRLMERKGMTQSQVAQAVSKGRSTIANALRLLDLPEDAQQLLFEGKITAGHARAILSVPTAAGKQKITEKLVNERLSVRETENIARLLAGQEKRAESGVTRPATPQSFKKAARDLRDMLQTNVRIKTVKGKNKIEIEFKDEKDLKRIFEQIASEASE